MAKRPRKSGKEADSATPRPAELQAPPVVTVMGRSHATHKYVSVVTDLGLGCARQLWHTEPTRTS